MAVPTPNQPPPHHNQHHQTLSSSSLFDPFFDPLSSRSPNPNSLLNLDIVWSKTLRSEPDLGGFMSASSPTQHFLTTQQQAAAVTTTSAAAQSRAASFPGAQIAHQEPESCNTRGSVSTDQTINATGNNMNSGGGGTNMARNPKKRSRASRRAPTTVLTTDTTNFRAMVQEFTGIPAPPFTSSSFPRSRLDLLGTPSSTLRSSISPPPYLLRPFAQKIHPPPFIPSSSSSSSLVDAIATTSTTTANFVTPNTSTSSVNYHLLPSDHLGLLKQQSHNLLNINTQNQNTPILNFSLLQPPPSKYTLPISAVHGAKPQGSTLDISPPAESHLKMGVLEEFGLSHAHVGSNLTGLQTIVSSSDVTLPATDNKSKSNSHAVNWGGGSAGSNESGQGLLRSINGGNYGNSQRVVVVATNERLNNNYGQQGNSSSDFHGDKGTGLPENVTARSEGMVETWICSSD
ncbi:rho GTPase-activating protein gacF-like [Carica papaya]|uniref:rho GTPase-activating protein gacF-like n=1 Tax=Carica papaya TaxID=3649 RepID=UPI000B8C6F93|nr:rho GTPase-activating protein gacF-like [Carica papaya]XP_021905318.1 rho GTPase-activating protein gacF-like [Carica papaya]